MKIVTSGSAYLDIDAYAGCIAYAELLRVLGEPAKAVSSAPLNDSICASLRAGKVGLEAHVPGPHDEFVLVDVSHPGYLDPLVDIDRVVAVFDQARAPAGAVTRSDFSRSPGLAPASFGDVS